MWAWSGIDAVVKIEANTVTVNAAIVTVAYVALVIAARDVEDMNLYRLAGLLFSLIYAVDLFVSLYFQYRQSVRFFTIFLLQRFIIGIGFITTAELFNARSVGFELSLASAVDSAVSGALAGFLSLWICLIVFASTSLSRKRR
jgi:hypothetical protein